MKVLTFLGVFFISIAIVKGGIAIIKYMKEN